MVKCRLWRAKGAELRGGPGPDGRRGTRTQLSSSLQAVWRLAGRGRRLVVQQAGKADAGSTAARPGPEGLLPPDATGQSWSRALSWPSVGDEALASSLTRLCVPLPGSFFLQAPPLSSMSHHHAHFGWGSMHGRVSMERREVF